MRWKVIVECCAPVVLGEGLATANVQSTSSAIAGSVWRGNLAHSILTRLGWLNNGSTTGCGPIGNASFQTVFLDRNATRFGYLYFCGPGPDLQWASAWETMPIPLTARTCKRREGFADSQGTGGHGVWDMLLPSIRRCGGIISESTSIRRTCGWPDCQERLDRLRGVLARQGASNHSTYRRVSVTAKPLVRVGLNRSTETAEEEILYLLEAITPSAKGKQYAVGFCYLTDHQERELYALLQKLPDAKLDSSSFSWTMYVGTARARGLGRVNVHMKKLPQGHMGPEDIAARLDNFQPAADGVLLDPSHLYFSFVLRSPTLIRDKNDCVATLPESHTLANYLPPEMQPCVQKWEILRKASAVETTTLTGWKQSWGLPKPVRYAVAAGSVWTYRVARTERHELLRVLDYIEANGLGESRAEGLGELIVCDPFHVVFDAGGNE